MLKLGARGTIGGIAAELVFVGLSHMNLERLKAGQPIKCMLSEFGVDTPIPVHLVIFAGETEQSMQRDVAELIGPNTKVSIDPRFKD